MGRPGFVLEVDDRTPTLLVPDGDRFQLEKFPLGTRVIYPAESLARVPDLGEAINAALDTPLESAPLSALLKPEMRLTIAFDDIGTPTPRMRRPDIRGKVIEAVLSRAAAAGVDDVALISANGLNRRMTPEELQYLVGERVFRSFYADGLLTNHDAEDADNLAKIGSTVTAEVALNARAASSDLLIWSRRPYPSLRSMPCSTTMFSPHRFSFWATVNGNGASGTGRRGLACAEVWNGVRSALDVG